MQRQVAQPLSPLLLPLSRHRLPHRAATTAATTCLVAILLLGWQEQQQQAAAAKTMTIAIATLLPMTKMIKTMTATCPSSTSTPSMCESATPPSTSRKWWSTVATRQQTMTTRHPTCYTLTRARMRRQERVVLWKRQCRWQRGQWQWQWRWRLQRWWMWQ